MLLFYGSSQLNRRNTSSLIIIIIVQLKKHLMETRADFAIAHWAETRTMHIFCILTYSECVYEKQDYKW